MHRKSFALLLPVLLLTGCMTKSAAWQEKDLFAMDTYMHFRVWSEDPAMPDLAETEIIRLEELLSATKTDSDIARINNAHGQPVTVSPETAEVITSGLEMGRFTDGAFNIALYPVTSLWGFTQEAQHVPDADAITGALALTDQSQIRVDGNTVTIPDGMQLDLGGLAKGYASSRVCSLLREKNVSSAILSLGGNVQTVGDKPDSTQWTVGIANPFSPSETICTVQVGETAVITSGNYQRYFEENGVLYHHILDPETGFPADNGLVSVTIFGENGLECDALSTALFVMGKDRAIEFWKEKQSFQMLLITDEPAVYYTAGLPVKDLPDIPVQVISHE